MNDNSPNRPHNPANFENSVINQYIIGISGKRKYGDFGRSNAGNVGEISA
jgi:hypothetical protein